MSPRDLQAVFAKKINFNKAKNRRNAVLHFGGFFDKLYTTLAIKALQQALLHRARF